MLRIVEAHPHVLSGRFAFFLRAISFFPVRNEHRSAFPCSKRKRHHVCTRRFPQTQLPAPTSPASAFFDLRRAADKQDAHRRNVLTALSVELPPSPKRGSRTAKGISASEGILARSPLALISNSPPLSTSAAGPLA
ncbi:hypothetical protein TRVL_09906 [Trypanosoma vivax]|nr:hypothetical protein TRVL_09906 [Trypanosoma vivax]